jgi:hypothetical protein
VSCLEGKSWRQADQVAWLRLADRAAACSLTVICSCGMFQIADPSG